jgi:hypothetical protein
VRTPNGPGRALRRSRLRRSPVALLGCLAVLLALAGCGSSAKVTDAIPRSSPEITPPESHGAESAALKKTRVSVISTSTTSSSSESTNGEASATSSATAGGEGAAGGSESTSAGEGGTPTGGGAAAPGSAAKSQKEGSSAGAGAASGGAKAP